MKLRFPLIVIALAALSIGMPAVSASGAVRSAVPGPVPVSSPGVASTPLVSSFTSPNWAGWMDLAAKDAQVYKVTAQFDVPTTSCPAAKAASYFWVGLDGWTDKTVEQAGTAAYCNQKSGSGYKAEYFDWYEMYPNKPVSEFFVDPGDKIIATVSYDSATGKYILQVTDKSRSGSNFRVVRPCPSGSTCDKASAEVITEDPGGGPADGQYLANFHSVTFSHIVVTSGNGTVGGLGTNSQWTTDKVLMEYQSKLMAKPSERNTALTGFTVTYKSKG
jgi:Peptidase A4 family